MSQQIKMIFYCGINETQWNYHHTLPGRYACIAPVYGASERTRRENRVKVPPYSLVLQDSGAFSDGPQSRLSLTAALDRQIEHGHKYHYHQQITHRASYDLLIDEMWTSGNRFKHRWTENEAGKAVAETICAAKFMAKNYNAGRVLSSQGVTPRQYYDCVLQVLEWFNTDADIFGLGGWCISGKMPAVMREPFDDTMLLVIPALARANCKRVHIWGVTDVEFLGPLLYLCDDNGLELSTDSSGASRRPAFGVWGYKGWSKQNYKRPDVLVRGIHRGLHVMKLREWLSDLRNTTYYRPPAIKPKQMVLF